MLLLVVAGRIARFTVILTGSIGLFANVAHLFITCYLVVVVEDDGVIFVVVCCYSPVQISPHNVLASS